MPDFYMGKNEVKMNMEDMLRGQSQHTQVNVAASQPGRQGAGPAQPSLQIKGAKSLIVVDRLTEPRSF